MSYSNPNSWQDPLILVPAISPGSNLSDAFAGMPAIMLQQFLSNAQSALAALLTGGLEVTISYGEGSGQKSVTYGRTNEGQLRRHIRELKILLGQAPRRNAIPIIF